MESDIKSLEEAELQCTNCEHNCNADTHGSSRVYPCGQQNCWWSVERADLEKQYEEAINNYGEED